MAGRGAHQRRLARVASGPERWRMRVSWTPRERPRRDTELGLCCGGQRTEGRQRLRRWRRTEDRQRLRRWRRTEDRQRLGRWRRTEDRQRLRWWGRAEGRQRLGRWRRTEDRQRLGRWRRTEDRQRLRWWGRAEGRQRLGRWRRTEGTWRRAADRRPEGAGLCRGVAALRAWWRLAGHAGARRRGGGHRWVALEAASRTCRAKRRRERRPIVSTARVGSHGASYST